jgi:hypothetical protein
VALFRTTLESLRARLPNLEYFIANSAGGDGNYAPADLDDVIHGFGNPVTTLENVRDGGAPLLSRPRGMSGAAESPEMSEPAKKRLRQDPPNGGREDNDSAAVEASVNLEFMVSSRGNSRGKED